MGGVYRPSEDTATLARALRNYEGDSCLEMGFGSGAILDSLIPRFKTVVGTDIISVAQAAEAKRDAEVVLADRATCFRDGSFDLVTFNPPYLPSELIEDPAVDGGRGGIQVPLSFLVEALRVVKKEGKIVLLLSDEGDVEGFREFCENRGLVVRQVASAGVFFENLLVFEIRLAQTGATSVLC